MENIECGEGITPQTTSGNIQNYEQFTIESFRNFVNNLRTSDLSVDGAEGHVLQYVYPDPVAGCQVTNQNVTWTYPDYSVLESLEKEIEQPKKVTLEDILLKENEENLKNL